MRSVLNQYDKLIVLHSEYVTKKEFEAYRKSSNLNKVLIGVITAIITAIFTAELMDKVIK